jgi:hypothetical protein
MTGWPEDLKSPPPTIRHKQQRTWLSVQLKVLDISGPLIYLHQLKKQGRPLDMEEVSENVKVALELTAAASYDSSCRRRRNILNHSQPSFRLLARGPQILFKQANGFITVWQAFARSYAEKSRPRREVGSSWPTWSSQIEGSFFRPGNAI